MKTVHRHILFFVVVGLVRENKKMAKEDGEWKKTEEWGNGVEDGDVRRLRLARLLYPIPSSFFHKNTHFGRFCFATPDVNFPCQNTRIHCLAIAFQFSQFSSMIYCIYSFQRESVTDQASPSVGLWVSLIPFRNAVTTLFVS